MSVPPFTPRALFLLLAALLFAGCARPIPPSDVPEASILWAHFQESRASLPDRSGFSLRGSINYASPERKHRVLLQIWGNPDYPVRADLRAGIGTHFAYLREDRLSSVAYFPQGNQVHLSSAPRIVTPEVALPFSLMELSAISLNLWQSVLPDEYLGFDLVPGVGWAFRFGDPRLDAMVIGFDGRPVSLHGGNGAAWVLEIRSWSRLEGRDVPERMVLTLNTGETAIITLREHALVPGGWEDRALELRFPPDARIIHNLHPVEGP